MDMTINSLSLLYIVIAIGLIPTFILICMNLWKIFKLLNHVDSVIDTADQAINVVRTQAVSLVKNVERVPVQMMNNVVSSIKKFF